MAEFEEFPHRTRRDPGVTHRDPHAPEAPAPGPAATRRDVPTAPADPLIRLPGSLAERFAVVGELPVQGAESDLLLVRDAAGVRYVVKVFRRGYAADRDVWAKLPALGSPHVVRILENGHADGRDYELSEYAPAGNLRAVMGAPLPPDTVAAIVAQLAAGLDALHRAGIVHRDLKPENILLTGTDPLQVAITDFGLSKVLDQSVVFASSSRTLAYAAPESLSGQVSPARDWWSLGMIVRELATGRPPFAGMSETVVVDHLATRPIDNSDVADPRLRLLCQGLLARDPRHRWTAAQVTGWLEGQSPPVAAESPASFDRPAPAAGPGLPFAGRRFTDRAELARALVERWDEAARYFFARGERGEAWRALRDWLAGFPDDGRIELIDGYLTTALPPDVKVLHLVRWLDPALPPHYLGRRVGAGDLPGLAALAGDPGHPDHRTACLIGRALWEHRLLPELAAFEGAADLRRIDDRWRVHVAEWNRLVGWLRGGAGPQAPSPFAGTVHLPDAGEPGPGSGRPGVPADEPPVVLLTLLALAAAPGQTASLLADAARRARAAVREPVPWFDQLAAWAGADDPRGGDPLRLLAVVRAGSDAALAAQAVAQERQVTERRLAERERHWAERERQRLSGRGAAMTRAVLWTLPLLALWLFGSLVVGSISGGGEDDGVQGYGGFESSARVPFGLLAAVSLLAWAAQCGAEVLLARRQGGDYLPYGPWSWLSKVLGAGGRGLSRASQTMSASARTTGRRGCGLLLLAGIVPLLIILLLVSLLTALAGLLWLLVLVMVPVAHAIAAGVRLHHWKAEHERARQASLGTP
ncbi:Protein kinase domain-containing protein [Thermomonospora echinospora]|uniref:non-specific serine/threonine protein kinase n=1 Tax=Thermomonospora echinospora TaxID=1992 RepID=A0A1H6A5L4_9ACTN|nr:serine/threonine-protein kinase [Thermomonospora echinospora]SEG43721.1 Protein kinase domain-containing protein [Thermomonospora echinospora]